MHHEMLDPLFMLFHLIVPASLQNPGVVFDFTSKVEDTKKHYVAFSRSSSQQMEGLGSQQCPSELKI